MKAIKFSETELEFLKNHYELELADAENYISEIKNILKKLGKEIKAADADKPKKRRGRPPKVKEEKKESKAAGIIAKNEKKKDDKKGGKKRGRKPKKTALPKAAVSMNPPAPAPKGSIKTEPKKEVKAAPKKAGTKKSKVKKAKTKKPAAIKPEPKATPASPEPAAAGQV